MQYALEAVEEAERYCKRCRSSKPASAFTQGYKQCDACRASTGRRGKGGSGAPITVNMSSVPSHGMLSKVLDVRMHHSCHRQRPDTRAAS